MTTAAVRHAGDRLRWVRVAVCAGAILASVPYAAVKVVWLAGGSLGSTGDGVGLHDPRHVVGNAVTLSMVAVAALLVVALTHPLGQRLPPALVLVPAWIGTGLLAPIVVGLPVGLVVQAIAGGPPAPAENELHGWVYAVVYGGFIFQGVALMTSFVLYVHARWRRLLGTPVSELASDMWLRRRAGLCLLAVIGSVLYAAANVAWAALGDSFAAPAGFETVAQRSLFVSVGLLTIGGAVGVVQLAGRWSRQDSVRLWVPLTLSWVGSATCFLSAVSQYALAADAHVGSSTALILGVGLVGGMLAITAVVVAVWPSVVLHVGHGR